MTDRDTPEPRPTPPGHGNTRLEAVERLRRQLDAIESRTRKSDKPSHLARYGTGVYSAETYGRRPDEGDADEGYPAEELTARRAPANSRARHGARCRIRCGGAVLGGGAAASRSHWGPVMAVAGA
ncbi:hypothetical protein [Nocardia otitidiscaviarum]|uniref:hypothetical protein n=1 Tax=Nocardia otitidiscaviarum TaxID=1823 RepID=UPI0004A6ED97|nr:hypothetical protein [Nocardia otitidiscaviarum]